MPRPLLATLLACLLLATVAPACLWDYDTLAMERARFPDALELITGKFLRHSDTYYAWRIDDRKALIADAPTPSHYDDLAVAYEKLGRHEEAIATALECERLYPGWYETQANLGTFYIHAGQFEKGIEHIDRALEINPDAHFGREKYQKLLVQYVLSRTQDGEISLPLRDSEHEFLAAGHSDFAAYVMTSELSGSTSPRDIRPEIYADAIKGVLGMIRFGQHDSPILMECLGDLLLAGRRDQDGLRLGSRCYLRAAYTCDQSEAATIYCEFAEMALGSQTHAGVMSSLPLDTLEQRFQIELADAEAWFRDIETTEVSWIKAGENVDHMYAVRYRKAPAVHSPWPPPSLGSVLLFLCLLAGGLAIARQLRLRGQSRRSPG